MLVEKDKLKRKMVEYISDQFWVNNKKPTFTEIYEQFQHYISKGSFSNYLGELVKEKQVVKENSGNNVFYGIPRMLLSTKVLLFFGITTPILSIFSSMVFKSLEPLYFGLGAIFVSFLWRLFGKK